MGLELSTAQFQTCQEANGQFCYISTPFQPLANPPTCIAALYAKSKASITSKCSVQLHKTTTHCSPHSDYTRCLDTHHSSYSPCQHHNPDMPRETHGNNCYSSTATHTETSYGLQCHFSTFLPTPQVWNSSFECQCITWHGKSPNGKHHPATLLYVAALGKQSQWHPTATPSDHTINPSAQSLSTSPQ